MGQLKERRLQHAFINERNLYLINGVIKLGGLEYLERSDKINLEEIEHLKFARITACAQYLAPEVLIRKKLSHNMSLYAVGVLMFRLLYGELPFEGQFTDLRDLSLMYQNEVCKVDFDGREMIQSLRVGSSFSKAFISKIQNDRNSIYRRRWVPILSESC